MDVSTLSKKLGIQKKKQLPGEDGIEISSPPNSPHLFFFFTAGSRPVQVSPGLTKKRNTEPIQREAVRTERRAYPLGAEAQKRIPRARLL